MRAWILDKQAPVEHRPLRLAEVPTPVPQHDEVRLRVLMCGVCRTDIHIAEGDLPLKRSPTILGHEIVGVVDAVGEGVRSFAVGDLAGGYWLHRACGHCKYCLSQRENYCPEIQCTGWDAPGGFAEAVTLPADYALPLNHIKLAPTQIAPLLCPGIAGYAAFQLTGAQRGDRLGLYGYGPTATYVLQVARSRGIEVYVSTRAPKNIEAARRDGALWAADATTAAMPHMLDAAILFPPAGSLVEPILSQLRPGGTLVLAPVSSSSITIENYSEHLWGRDIRTLYNLSRADAQEFSEIINQLNLSVGVTVFPFEQLPDALVLAKQGKLEQPNVVIRVTDG